jgi:hypothetical protein
MDRSVPYTQKPGDHEKKHGVLAPELAKLPTPKSLSGATAKEIISNLFEQ